MKRRYEQGPFLPEDVPTYSTRFDFVGISKRNKGKTYRSYANDLEHAKLDICFSHRLSESDFKLVKVF